jgi:hypothetical protein
MDESERDISRDQDGLQGFFRRLLGLKTEVFPINII